MYYVIQFTIFMHLIKQNFGLETGFVSRIHVQSMRKPGRWEHLETSFEEEKVDIALLQGTRETGCCTKAGKYYRSFLSGAVATRQRYSTGVAGMMRNEDNERTGDSTLR